MDRFRRRISDYSYDKIRVLSNLLTAVKGCKADHDMHDIVTQSIQERFVATWGVCLIS